MQVTLTGAAGQLGRQTWRELLSAGHKVLPVDRVSQGQLPGTVEQVDLLNVADARRVVASAEALVHVANHPGMDAIPDPVQLFNENVTMNMNIFQAAADHGVRIIAFASSTQVIASVPNDHAEDTAAAPYLPLDGEVPPNPTNLYALSKSLSEEMLRYLSRLHGICTVSIRFPWLTEPEQLARPLKGAVRPYQAAAGFSWLTWSDGGRLINAILAAQLDGYRVYMPAAATNSRRQTPAGLIKEHYPGVELKRPLDEIAALVDISRIREETGWTPLDG